MKRVLMCANFALLCCIGIQAQTTLPASFGNDQDGATVSLEGTTLTINGHGDLTKMDASFLFTNTYNKVFADENGTQVAEGTTFSDASTYYTRSDVYTPITEDFTETYTTSKTDTWREFNATAANEVYKIGYDWNNNKPTYTLVKEGDKVNTTQQWIGGNNVDPYYKKGEDGTYTAISADEINSDTYTTEKSKTYSVYSNCSNVFYKNGNTYLQVYNGQDVVEGRDYFTRSFDYQPASFDDLWDLGVLYSKSKFIDALVEHCEAENIVFVNDTPSTPLYINQDIIDALFYYKKDNQQSWMENKVLKELDLGQTTCKNLSSKTFQDLPGKQNLSLTSLTLPLSESKKVPARLFSPNSVTNKALSKIVIPEGYTAIGDSAFVNMKIKDVVFPSTLDSIGNYAFNNCDSIDTLKLNEGLTYIGKYAFLTNSITLVSVLFPSTLDKIDDAAFLNANGLRDITFNEGLRYIGNSAFGGLNNDNLKGLTTLTIPSSVRFIGSGAFFLRQYQDVFFESEVAPLMPTGASVAGFQASAMELTAFPPECLQGNNGFDANKQEGNTSDDVKGKGYANRENYKSNGVYFTMLHYPNNITDKEKLSTYTDTLRVYHTWGPGQAIDQWYGYDNSNGYFQVGKETKTLYGWGGNPIYTTVTYGFHDTYVGDRYVWPSQAQWNRAYGTALNGVGYDGVTLYRTKLTDEELQILAEAGYVVGTGEGQYSLDSLQEIAHKGTRMFVLSNPDTQPHKDYEIKMEGGKWWTLCVPFNMTKKQVDEVFGEETQVCLFNKVCRDRNTTTNINSITLFFTLDVCHHKSTQKSATGYWDYETIANNSAPADDDIVIYAHESYMIHPSKTPEDAVFVVKDYSPIVGNPSPTIITSSETNGDIQASDEEGNEYRFVGNYIGGSDAQNILIPQYSYVFAKRKNQDEDYKFWFYTGTTSLWKPNKSLVQVAKHEGGVEDWENFFNTQINGAQQNSFFGTDPEVDAVEHISIVAGTHVDAPIYTLNGVMVSRNGDSSQLAKGVYIQNGKKFIVK